MNHMRRKLGGYLEVLNTHVKMKVLLSILYVCHYTKEVYNIIVSNALVNCRRSIRG